MFHKQITVNGMCAYLIEITKLTYLTYSNIVHASHPDEPPISLEKFMTETMNDVASSIRLGIKNGEINVVEDKTMASKEPAKVIETSAEVKTDGKN